MAKPKQLTFDEVKEIEMSERKEIKRVKEVKGPYKLPEGWRWVKLGDITEVNKYSVNPPKDFPNKKFIYIDISGVENGTGRIKEVKVLLGKDAPSRARRLVHTNDILMSTVRPYLKGFAIVPSEYDNQVCSTGFAVLTPKREILPKFVLFSLFTDILMEQYNRMMLGAHYPALTNEQVNSLKIPLPFKDNKPDLEEQKRIVAKIEELFSKIDRIKELRKQAKEEAENLLKAALHQVFSKADEWGWRFMSFNQIIDTDAKFFVGKIKTKEIKDIGKVPVVDQGKKYISGFTDRDDLTYQGPLPVIIFGDHTTVVKYVDFNFVIGADGVKVLVPKYMYAYPKYLFYCLSYISSRISTGEYKRHYLILRQQKFPTPFKDGKPDLEEQKRITAYFDRIVEKQRKLLELYEQTEKELEIMKQAILNKAFRGQL